MSDAGNGLNLIEDNITAAGGFPRATMGGYQRQAVDEHVTYLEGQVRAARRQIRKLEDKVAELTAKVASRPRLEEIDYADLGGHAGQMLSAAQNQAREILDEARIESERVRNEAAEHTARIRADADNEGADIRQTALAEMAVLRAQLDTDATGEIARAREESAALVAAAQREAETVRLAALQDAGSTREQARLEAEQVVASATRQANDLRAAVSVEREDTLAELSRSHAEHVARTTALLDEARRHHQESQERLSHDIGEASRIRTDALTQAEQIKIQSLRETEDRVATATRQSRVMQERMQDRFARHKDKMRREIEVLANRRKAMISQLSQLADHVRDSTGGFDVDEADELSRLLADDPVASGEQDSSDDAGSADDLTLDSSDDGSTDGDVDTTEHSEHHHETGASESTSDPDTDETQVIVMTEEEPDVEVPTGSSSSDPDTDTERHTETESDEETTRLDLRATSGSGRPGGSA